MARNRFIEGMDQHTAAMTEQADDRSRGYLPMRSIASYLDLRRHTMGAKPAFAFLAFDFDLPAHVFENPFMENLERWAADLLILSNVSQSITSTIPKVNLGFLGSLLVPQRVCGRR